MEMSVFKLRQSSSRECVFKPPGYILIPYSSFITVMSASAKAAHYIFWAILKTATRVASVATIYIPGRMLSAL